MGMSPEAFWDLLPREFFLKQHGFNAMMDRKDRNDWEMVRWQTAFLLQPHMKKGKQLKPTSLIKFPWFNFPLLLNQTDGDSEFFLLKESVFFGLILLN